MHHYLLPANYTCCKATDFTDRRPPDTHKHTQSLQWRLQNELCARLTCDFRVHFLFFFRCALSPTKCFQPDCLTGVMDDGCGDSVGDERRRADGSACVRGDFQCDVATGRVRRHYDAAPLRGNVGCHRAERNRRRNPALRDVL